MGIAGAFVGSSLVSDSFGFDEDSPLRSLILLIGAGGGGYGGWWMSKPR